jgi:oxygen-dependent protoporphyrinogen oxidase
VSFYYPETNLTAKFNGFGYLLPQSTPNPEEALGVFFDSDTYGLQPGEKPGTKLTVLMGGHFWDSASSIPSEAECVSRGLAIMKRHLAITRDPDLIHVNLAMGCIPQHVIGHRAILARTHEALDKRFKGRLALAGGSYTAVGVMPAIRAGYDVACHVARKALPHVGDTGLAQFTRPAEVVEVERKVLNGLGKQLKKPDVVQRFFMGL